MMRNYRNVAATNSMITSMGSGKSQGAGIYFGLDADKPSLNGISTTIGISAPTGLGYKFSDNTFWVVKLTDAQAYQINLSGAIINQFAIANASNGCEIDGDNEDFLWVTSGNLNIYKYQISTKSLVSQFAIVTSGQANGVCAPAGEYIWVGMDNPHEVLKVQKSNGAVISTYPANHSPSDLAWDGSSVWLSFSDSSIIESHNPNSFEINRTITGSYPAHPGLTFDGTHLWTANTDNNILAEITEGNSSSAILYYATDTKKIYWNVNGVWTFAGTPIFLDLSDTPSSYTGQKGKVVSVKQDESGIEFIPPSAGTSTTVKTTGHTALSGDIELTAGTNITLAQDDTTKKITINAAAGGGTAGDATSIKGKPVQAPTSSDDGKALVFDNATGTFIYEAASSSSSPPSTYVNAVPPMTSGTTNGVTVTDLSHWSTTEVGWKLFDGISGVSGNDWAAASVTLPQWVKVDFGANPAEVVVRYAIVAANQPAKCASAWNLEGSNDNAVWDMLDSRSGYIDWVAYGSKAFNLSNITPYRYYRISVTATVTSGSTPVIGEVVLYKDGGGLSASQLNHIPVDTSSPVDGYVLTYDAASGKIMFKPKV
jgi:hypothetical protein